MNTERVFMFMLLFSSMRLLSGQSDVCCQLAIKKTDTISYTNAVKPEFFYKAEALTNRELVKMLDVNAFKKAGLSLRKAKRGYFVNKGLGYLAGALVSYPFFSALFNKDLYAGPCIMAAGTVLVNLNVSKNYNKLLLSLVKEHNQKVIAGGKKTLYYNQYEKERVL